MLISYLWLICSLLLLPYVGCSPRNVKIGIVHGQEDDLRQNSDRFWSSTQNYTSQVTLKPEVQIVPWWGTLPISRAVCQIVKKGVSGLVTLGPPKKNSILASYSNLLGVPLVTAATPDMQMGRFQVNLMPQTVGAVRSMLNHYGWKSFVYFYESDIGTYYLEDISRSLQGLEIVAAWRVSSAEEALHYIQFVDPISEARHVLMATSERLADELVPKLAGFGINFHLILTIPVGIVREGSKQKPYILTKFSFVNSGEALLKSLENRWKTLEHFRQSRKDIPDAAILTHDISRMLHNSFGNLARSDTSPLKNTTARVLDCLSGVHEITHEQILAASFMRNVDEKYGVTGRIKFNEKGQRMNYSLSIYETVPLALKKIGSWSDSSGLKISEESPQFQTEKPISAAYRGPPIIVTSIIVNPFLKLRMDGSLEGYVVDFLDELMKIIGQDYELRLVKDGKYGYPDANNQWTGMIGELVRQEADMALAPLTKTTFREKVVDFSKNFMTFGLNILFAKPASLQDGLLNRFGAFSFLSVWATEIWILILAVWVLFALASYATSRFIGAPDRIRALETKGSDNLSLCSAFWFTAGSLLFRGTGIYPRSLAHRVWAVIWWGFSLFLLTMYISTLSAALIRSRTSLTMTHSRMSSHQMLKKALETGYPNIGILGSGSTAAFFKASEIGVYRDFGRYLSDNPEVMVKTYSEGVSRVRQSDGAYAFLMESGSSEVEINTPPCEVIVTSGFLDTKSYAVAFRKNSPLRESIDDAILQLMEAGTLRTLYERWWYNSTTSCEDPNLDILPHVYNTSMTLHEVSGVFCLLVILILLSVGVAAVEHYFSSRQISMD